MIWASTSPDGDLKHLSREDVFSVKIGNGDMQLLSTSLTTQDIAATSNISEIEENTGPLLIERKTDENNRTLIDRYNRTTITGIKEDYDLFVIGFNFIYEAPYRGIYICGYK